MRFSKLATCNTRYRRVVIYIYTIERYHRSCTNFIFYYISYYDRLAPQYIIRFRRKKYFANFSRYVIYIILNRTIQLQCNIIYYYILRSYIQGDSPIKLTPDFTFNNAFVETLVLTIVYHNKDHTYIIFK